MKTQYVETRPVRNRYLVRERDRRRLRELARVTAAVLVLGVAALGYTWLHLAVVSAGYRIDDLAKRLDELDRVESHLELEASYLASPPRVAERAATELGMQAPTDEQLVFVEVGP